ncbi:NAD-dependent epimerase/dehydratase family protein [Hyphococcus lacteus]|uniref:NAD-dependent epimerase/dehydratase family protein n=1 Tax=Hyphococcus lacteus TaxID=3143536 RepID=A0ABV3YZZ8_9PROT
MQNKPIRAALLGAGYISSWHGNVLRRLPNVEITAVCDLSLNAAKNLADQYGAPNVFTSLEEMLAANVADCIHVLTPPNHHRAATEQILNAGVAAFVEKPFALNAAECHRLDALATEKNVALGVNHNFLMLPSYDKLKAAIKNKTIGPIDTFEANWQFPLTPLRSGPFSLWMLRQPQNLLFELGPHLFAFVADIFGELENVSVELRNPIVIPGGITHHQNWQITGTAMGAAVTLNLSLVEGHDNRSLRVRGIGAVAQYDFAEDAYRIEQASMKDIVVAPLMRQFSLAGQSLKTGITNAIRQTKSLNAQAPYGLSIHRAIESFYQSLASGEPVDRRLSAGLAARTIELIEVATEQATPKFIPTQQPQTHETKPSNDMTMLVIGGTGFIGRALCHALADEGYHVRVFSRGRGAGFERTDNRISVFTGSLKSDTDLTMAMDGVTGVYHLAKATEASWEGYLENDVAVTRRIGEACLAAGVERLVYTGTIDSYDASQADRPITEDTPFDHDLERRNLYARSKAACEMELNDLAATRGLPLVIVRPGIVIGKGGPLQHWGIAMWRGATACKLWGDGRNIMPFVLVDDVADGLVAAMQAENAAGKSFNLIGDPLLSGQDYFKAIEDGAGVAMRAQPTPIWTYYTVDVIKYWLKRVLAKRSGLTKPSMRDWKSRAQLSPYRNEKAKEILGWLPESDRTRFIERGITNANLFGLNKK